MARVLRTSIRPRKKVLHQCRDRQGRRVNGYANSNTVCPKCGTYIVYVWDNEPTKVLKTKRRYRGS